MSKKKPWYGPVPAIVGLLLVVSTLSGCGGGVHATTWTGLVVHEGVVYAADLEQVRALDAESGAVLWLFPAEPDMREYGPFYTVTLLEETLFVTSYERTGSGFFAQSKGVLRALNSQTGQQLWKATVGGGEFVAAGALTDSTFVIGNSDGMVYTFRKEDGAPVWERPFAAAGRVWATPLVISDTVYIASLDHSLYALDLATGQERWRFEAVGAMASQPLLLDQRLYIGAFDGHLYALRQQDGHLEWSFEGESWFWGSPTTDGALIYATDVGGNVYAVDIESGQQVWRSTLDQPFHLGPALNPDGQILLVAGDSGTLYGLDASDGFVIWSQPGKGQLASLVVDGNVAYVSRINAEQRIQAFYVDNGRPLWVYPQPQASE